MNVKKILYLTFYFEPDLSAGSFRNAALANALSELMKSNGQIELYTTQPNRYATYKITAAPFEQKENISIHRISIPPHKNNFIDQAWSYQTFYREVLKATKGKHYDLVFVSSGRFFSSYLGYQIAKRNKSKLYLDVRDIFSDTMKDVLKRKLISGTVLKYFKRLERKTYSYASHINLVSEGFKEYFQEYQTEFSFYTNGIDDAFLKNECNLKKTSQYPQVITYAGNIGEGQGLEKIIPPLAKILSNKYQFNIIGDGGSVKMLEKAIAQDKLNNVSIIKPVDRDTLIKYYQKSDYLFLHLNDYDAFRKVLPSKIFEYAAFPLPIIAGVAGYAETFIKNNIQNAVVFKPGNAEECAVLLKNQQYQLVNRAEFIQSYSRTKIVKRMAENILSYL